MENSHGIPFHEWLDSAFEEFQKEIGEKTDFNSLRWGVSKAITKYIDLMNEKEKANVA